VVAPPEPPAPPDPGEVPILWRTTVPVMGRTVGFGVRVKFVPETQYE
jgi:hypothetical protein